MTRAVVVGAGVGGLAVGVRLVAAGHRVTVCEAAQVVGGKLGRQVRNTEQGRFTFDTGPTLLSLPQVFSELFDDSGGRAPNVKLRRLDTIADYRFADGTRVSTVSDPAEQREVFDGSFGPGAGAAWQAAVERGAAIWGAVEEPIFGQIMSTRALPSLARRGSRMAELRTVAPHRSLRSLANQLLPDARQRLMLERYATYEGSDPRRAPAALAVVPYLEQRYGAWYVDGGLYGLATALADRFVTLGGELRLGARVEEIVGTRRVDQVRLADGTRLPAEAVVSDVDARVLYGELHRTRRRTVPPADSLSGFVLLLSVRDPLPDLGHHTVFYGSAPYEDEFDAVFGERTRTGRRGPGRPVADPVIYLSAPRDSSVAPAGCRAVYVLVNAARHSNSGEPGTVDWTAPGLADRYADRVLSLLAARGLDLRSKLVGRDVRTPADLERETGAPGGAIYGQVQHGALATFRRSHNRSRTPGLFLVGGSTHPGGGLPLVAMSARAVAAEIGPA